MIKKIIVSMLIYLIFVGYSNLIKAETTSDLTNIKPISVEESQDHVVKDITKNDQVLVNNAISTVKNPNNTHNQTINSELIGTKHMPDKETQNFVMQEVTKKDQTLLGNVNSAGDKPNVNDSLIIEKEDIKYIFTNDLFISIFSVFFGWLLHAWYTRYKTKEVNKSGWNVIAAEAANCTESAEKFIKAKIGSPQYRLPTNGYLISYPLLISNGLVSKQDALELSLFYSSVEALNIGLDNANTLLISNEEELLAILHSRNVVKAKTIIKDYKKLRCQMNKKLKGVA